MDSIWIKGGARLEGEIPISGAKNAALTLMPLLLWFTPLARLRDLPKPPQTRAMESVAEEMAG